MTRGKGEATAPRPSDGGDRVSAGVPVLPTHVEQTVGAIARLHAEHEGRATRLERVVERLTAWIARPAFIGLLTVAVAAWVGGNLLSGWLGWREPDQPPFTWLADAIGLSALYVTALILTTQRRDDELTERREQLTLELAILADKRSAKIIELLEALRADDPHLRDRADGEAAAMASPADPQAMLDALGGTPGGPSPPPWAGRP